MGDRKIRFRKAIGGYNKEDVNAFIEEISARYNSSENESQRKIKELQNQVNELQVSLDSIKDETDVELNALRVTNESNANTIAELQAKLEAAVNENEALINENGALKIENAGLKAQSEQFASACEKSDMYDKVSEQIGSMIVSANAKAETIVKEAEEKALADRNDMIDNAAARIRNMNAKYTGSLKEKTGSISDDLQRIVNEIERFNVESQMALEIESQNIKEETNKDHSEALGEE
ncbi:MAG: DivIVA domain-containing protein [Clostridia bacterium]|nr:DivIVA domain-containing protein [Clostridia bacterium]